ncbi:MAG: UvrD-helicase domain-containing protein [Gammaproteobacteria bacterium]|nr:UvrD-helicase domain-containing protein [Gammaproteobacteria bacterium]
MLNPEQKEAVKYLDGPLLVLAGAGSGKTRVITEKIVYLIEQCDYRPAHICAVTFTNKAATEMRERVSARLALEKRRGLKVMTFHTLGLRILKSHAQLVGRRKGFSIFDADDCLQILAGLVSASQARDRAFLQDIQQKISMWKNTLLSPDAVKKQVAAEGEFGVIYTGYQHALQAYNAVDFDDLICLPVWLFKQEPSVLAAWQNKIRYLLVDEYQDSNDAQYELVKSLMNERGAFTVVGDNFQSIYAWRGAKPENLKQLQHDFPTLKLIKLEQNYRSTRTILAVANALMTDQTDAFSKMLWSDLGVGESVRVISCQDEQDEADQVVADLMSHRLRFGRRFGEYAILYRGNHQARLIEKVLRHYGVAYRLSGGQSWFGRVEVKDMIAYLRLLGSPENDAAFLRAVLTPKKGIGEASLEKLSIYAGERGASLYDCADHLALTTLIGEKPRQLLNTFKSWIEEKKAGLRAGNIALVLKEIVDESGYEAYVYEQTDSPQQAQRKMESVQDLMAWIEKQWLAQSESDLSAVLNKLMLIDLLDRQHEQAEDEVNLLTLHAAKGLEFPYVYLIGMEEELLPHHACLEGVFLDEERRLFYVGMTRAQRELSLSYARHRKRAGALQATTPSRFLDALPEEHLVYLGIGEQARDPVESQALASSHLQGMMALLK